MKSENRSSQSTHALVAILTLAFCVAVFQYFLPEKILEKAGLVLKTDVSDVLLAQGSNESLPQGLVDFIQQQHSTANSVSDSLDKTQLADTFKDFEEDYLNVANEIISNRFKKPDLDNASGSIDAFAVPEGLKDQVNFWTHIFGLYTLDHTIFYNEDDVGIVYSVLDFSELADVDSGSTGSIKAQMLGEEKMRLASLLKNAARRIKDNDIKSDDIPKDEQRVIKLLMANNDHVDISEESLLNSLKSRNGFAHRIKTAIVQSGAYMEEMQRIFKDRGLPTELTMIPFIESSFNLNAYSSAGAAGIWQFIEGTGERYLHIDEFVDERYDPILAAYAAATHLANEYRLLGSWPLTINAYNTGPGRMLQAQKELNTSDIATIIKQFKGAGYGVDSRNYFPEFLAAVIVYQNQQQFFGDITPLPPQQHQYVAMPCDTNVRKLARLSGLSSEALANMNRSLKPAVVAGNIDLPKGYLLNIPPESKQDVVIALEQINSDLQYATSHLAKEGDTLKKISKIYDIPVNDLAAINKVMPGQKFKSGDVIVLPQDSPDDVEISALSKDESEKIMPDDVENPVF